MVCGLGGLSTVMLALCWFVGFGICVVTGLWVRYNAGSGLLSWLGSLVVGGWIGGGALDAASAWFPCGFLFRV